MVLLEPIFDFNFPFRFLVRVSYLEIYNENVRDLLGKDQNAKLEVCGLYCQKQMPGTLFFKIIYTLILFFIIISSGFLVSSLLHMISLMGLGEGETRCWRVCEGFVLICHEQC